MGSKNHPARWDEGAARGPSIGFPERAIWDPLRRPRWMSELDHIAAADRARQAASRPKVPDRIICHRCGSVPRNSSARARFHVSEDGSAWECAIYPRCKEETWIDS